MLEHLLGAQPLLEHLLGTQLVLVHLSSLVLTLFSMLLPHKIANKIKMYNGFHVCIGAILGPEVKV